MLASGERGFYGCEDGGGQAVAVVHVGDVGCEACLGVLIREETDVGESPAEGFGWLVYCFCLWVDAPGGCDTIRQEDYSLGERVAGGFGNVGWQAGDFALGACGRASGEGAGKAAWSHGLLFRHGA